MNCTLQKQQTVFILFTTESVIFILAQLNESCVCLPKRMLKRQKCASKIEKRFIGYTWLDFGSWGMQGQALCEAAGNFSCVRLSQCQAAQR